MNPKWFFIYCLLSLFVIFIFGTNEINSIISLSFEPSQKKAHIGFPSDQISLADIYYKKKQYKKSLFWYKQATRNGSFYPYHEIMKIYLKINNRNKVFEKNNIYKLIDMYQKWAKAGDIEAQKLLIDLSCQELSPKNNYKKILYKKWKNNPYMMFDCILYKNNLEIGKDNEKIINLFNKLASKKNDIRFKYELWTRVYSEEQKKYNIAIFKKAISNKYPKALLFYGFILLNSEINIYKKYYELTGFPNKEKKAIEIFEKLSSSKWNSINSWMSIGSNFAYQIKIKNGKLETKQNFKEAIKWYKKSYVLGDSEAAYHIGKLYKESNNTLAQNKKKAFEWFYKSAIKNYMPAQIEIGDMYFNGLGVEKNQTEAIKWYKKAYTHNSFFCGVCYKTDLMLNKLGFISFFKNIKQIY